MADAQVPRIIPSRRPDLRAELTIPDAERDEPVVARDGLAVFPCHAPRGGRLWLPPALEAEASVCVLVGIDLETAAERFSVSIHPEGPSVFADAPDVSPDGQIYLPVFHERGRLEVLVISPEGRVERRDDLGPHGSRIEVSPELLQTGFPSRYPRSLPIHLAATADGYLSWMSDPIGGSPGQMECRSGSTGVVLWKARSELHSATDRIAVAWTFIPDIQTCHDARDGRALWARENPPHARSFLLCLDEEDILERSSRGGYYEDYPGPPRKDEPLVNTISLRSTATGRVQWAREFEEERVLAALLSPHVVVLLLLDERSAGRMVRLGRGDGTLLGESRMFVRDPTELHPLGRTPAGLVAADDAHLLWFHGTRLVCEALADPGRIVWEMELPSPCVTVTSWRPRSHLSPASVAVHRGTILLRDGPRVRVYAGPTQGGSPCSS